MLTDDDLRVLSEYKYRSIDKSPTSYYILNPFWTWCTSLFPTWYAPNLITLTGLAFVVGNLVLVELLVPDLVGPGPSWLYYSMAAGLFLYQTFDNCDGKQARRTGTSSPLGELFDHGVDSLNCTLAGLLMVVTLGLGSTRLGAFFTLVSAWPMYFSTWEQAHTGVLYLGFINGPTEGILIACGVMLVSAVLGPQIWLEPTGFGSLIWRDIFVGNVLVALFFVHVPGCVWNVRAAGKQVRLVEWLPLLAFTASSWFWATSPFGHILAHNHLVLWALQSCLVFGQMTTQAILAHLLHKPYPIGSTIMLTTFVGCVVVNAPLIGLPGLTHSQELVLIYVTLAVTLAMYLHWALGTISAFCRFLDINCLTIKSRGKHV
ncbi:hypothetical protein PYCC9005_005354 [Savitreella phatthalungensis]